MTWEYTPQHPSFGSHTAFDRLWGKDAAAELEQAMSFGDLRAVVTSSPINLAREDLGDRPPAEPPAHMPFLGASFTIDWLRGEGEDAEVVSEVHGEGYQDEPHAVYITYIRSEGQTGTLARIVENLGPTWGKGRGMNVEARMNASAELAPYFLQMGFERREDPRLGAIDGTVPVVARNYDEGAGTPLAAYLKARRERPS